MDRPAFAEQMFRECVADDAADADDEGLACHQVVTAAVVAAFGVFGVGSQAVSAKAVRPMAAARRRCFMGVASVRSG
jgi:hypothetical protein